MRNLKSLACAGAILAAAALAGCTSDQQAQADAAIQAACVAGATIGVQVSGPGGIAFAPIVQAVAPGACAGIIALAESQVAQIVASGGQADVAVSTTIPATASKAKRTVRRRITVTQNTVTVHVAVGPNPVPGF